MKNLSREHVRLLSAAEKIRATLRRLATTAPEPTRGELLALSAILTSALKARETPG